MKIIYTVLSLALLASSVSNTLGQAFEHLNTNEINARFYSHGMIGRDGITGEPDFEVPAGGGVHPLFAASLWVGGQDLLGDIRLAALRFDQVDFSDYAPGPLTTDGLASITPAVSAQYDQVWTVNATDVAQHQSYFDCLATPGCDVNVQFPGYTIPPSFLSWPGNGDVLAGQAPILAPFIDADMDGMYEPSTGDAPCIQGDQALFFIFNDKLNVHASGGLPIGLEVHAMPYAFFTSDPALAHTIFIKYRLINRGSHTLPSASVGLFTDFDLGNGNDDFVGCDPDRGLWYAYNGDADDETTSDYAGYGLQPPAFGAVLLRGPLLDPNGMDDPDLAELPSWNGTGFGDATPDNERHGLSRVRFFDNNGTVRGDPDNAVQYLGYLNDRWKDSSQCYYGGTGYVTVPDSSDVPARFAFPDTTDPFGMGTSGIVLGPWAEYSAGNQPYDRRAVGSSSTFQLDPGEVIDLVYAFIYARAGSGGPFASVAALQERTDSVRALFTGMNDGCNGAGSQVGMVDGMKEDIRVYPTPAQDQLHVQSAYLLGAVLTVMDTFGRVLIQQRSSGSLSSLDLTSLAPGEYLLRIVKGEERHVVPIMKGP